jgi:hypothetical protein
MKIPYTPIKVIDTFLESPDLWREYALNQEYYRDELAPYPGLRTRALNELNPELFASLARKLIKHCHGAREFPYLEITFALVDETFGTGWIHQDESQYNVAGLIYLNPIASSGTGTAIYNYAKETHEPFMHLALDEYNSRPEDRVKFEADKQRQQSCFIKTMTVENEFNRCIMFHPNHWHGAEQFFGNTKDTTRLTINFFGVWQ